MTTNTALATTGTLTTLVSALAQRLNLGTDPRELIDTLKNTAFRGKDAPSDAQLSALLVVSQEYGLNPFTKEIYAFPSERGIVPIISIDGWIRIVNEHPQFDGLDFGYEEKARAMQCTIYRKDRSRPIQIVEYLDECKRNTDPWNKMPMRMLRHKALIQCARVAFGFAAYDDEEGAAAAGMVIDNDTGEILEPTKRGPQRASEAAAAPPPAAAPTPAPAAAVATGGPAAAPAPAPAPASANGSVPEIAIGQVNYLRNKLKHAGIAEQTICDRFQVAGIELLKLEQFDELRAELL